MKLLLETARRIAIVARVGPVVVNTKGFVNNAVLNSSIRSIHALRPGDMRAHGCNSSVMFLTPCRFMSSSSKTKYNNNNTFDEDEDGDDEEEDDEEDEDDSDDEDVEEEWDEEKYGAANTKHWQGFDGDLDAITDEGVPTWLQSVRTLNAIDEEKRMRAKLARRAAEEAKMNIVRVRKVDEFGRAYGTGRRKTSTARVWIKEAGTPFGGRVIVNKKDFVEYFARDTYREDILKPFSVLNKMGHFDVWCTVKGGGLTGQSGAIRHGISRALQHFNPDFRGPLKKEGFLTRDPRMVERKKPGQPKARKKFQWVKR